MGGGRWEGDDDICLCIIGLSSILPYFGVHGAPGHLGAQTELSHYEG